MRAKNKDFDSIRMNIIGLLNSYDWQNKVIDNTEEVLKGVNTCLNHYLHTAENELSESGRDLTVQVIQREAEINILKEIIKNLNDWL